MAHRTVGMHATTHHNTLGSFSFFIHMVFIIFTCHFSCLVTTDVLLGESVNLLFLNLLTSEVGSSDGRGGDGRGNGGGTAEHVSQ